MSLPAETVYSGTRKIKRQASDLPLNRVNPPSSLSYMACNMFLSFVTNCLMTVLVTFNVSPTVSVRWCHGIRQYSNKPFNASGYTVFFRASLTQYPVSSKSNPKDAMLWVTRWASVIFFTGLGFPPVLDVVVARFMFCLARWTRFFVD